MILDLRARGVLPVVVTVAVASVLGCAPRSHTWRSRGGEWLVDQAAFAFETLTRQGATWGMLVVRSTGEIVIEHRASTMFVPASNVKLVTTACALERFGPEHGLLTLLVLDGHVRADTAFGDLVIMGAGDPSFASPDSQFGHPLTSWCDSVRARGIRVVAGRVLGCGDFLSPAMPGTGWAWDDLGFGFAARTSGLCFHDNVVNVTLTPGLQGEDVRWVAEPAIGAEFITCSVLTGAPGSPRSLRLTPSGRDEVVVSGVMPSDDQEIRLQLACGDPPRMAAEELRRTLSARGVLVTEEAGTGCAPGGTLVASHVSLSLAHLIRFANEQSKNMWAEQLLRLIGRDEGADSYTTEEIDAVHETLDQLGIPREGLHMVDGSGLSRLNLASPSFMVELLLGARDRPWGSAFAASLPVAGRSGTLQDRMKGTVAEGRIRAKTGSMQGVRSLSGYVNTTSGDELAFSVMINGYPGSGAVMDRALDRFCTLLVMCDP